ncbi:hypothetical protein DL768_003588 [Monosporascus sp. mg162]|nr:hypothetical protein DL768_003588 [Monosporascus sp. mg162]
MPSRAAWPWRKGPCRRQITRRRRTSLEIIKQGMRIDVAGGRDADPADTASPWQHFFRVVDPVEQTVFSGIDRAHEGPRRHPLTPEKKPDRYKPYQPFEDPKYQGKISSADTASTPAASATTGSTTRRSGGAADATRDFVCLDGSGHPVAEDQGGRTRPGGDQGCVPRRAPRRRGAGEAPVVRAAGAWDRDRINTDLGNLSKHFKRMADASAAGGAYYSFDGFVLGKVLVWKGTFGR